MREIIIFGAGQNGVKLLQRLGKEKVTFFCDNNKTNAVGTRGGEKK